MSDLTYADDVVLVGSNCDNVQAVLDRVQAAARGVGMTINASKTKVMPSLVDPINWQPLTPDGVNLKDMQSFVYLGSTIMPSGQGAAEMERRRGAASGNYRCDRDIHSCKSVHLSSHCPDDPSLWMRNVTT